MSAALRRLCYFSQSLIEGSAEAKAQEIERLLAVARRVNAEMSVTGMLMTSEDCFAQILEGTPEAVGEIYGRIRQDGRHAGVTLLRDDPVADRAFAGWAMRSVHSLSWPQLAAMRPQPLYERLNALATEPAAPQ
ncbi:MAG: BLUF domain-containing protein [Acetobacteraceae bacterium]|nr:MAG: BLUF domain-containing protein [Acetobacteraceae bacterium]